MSFLKHATLCVAIALLCHQANTAQGFTVPDPGKSGSFAIQSTKVDVDARGYRSAIVHWPQQEGVYPSVIVTGGFTNTKENMSWLSKRLASHGFVVLTFTPTNVFGNPSTWQKGFESAIETLDRINTDGRHRLFQAIDMAPPALVGYSMGGGGAFLTARSNPGRTGPIVLLAPYLSGSKANKIENPTLLITGSRDSVAPASRFGMPIFRAVPAATDKVYLQYTNFGHQVFHNAGNLTQHYRLSWYLTSFLRYYQADDGAYSDNILGNTSKTNIKSEWLSNWSFSN